MTSAATVLSELRSILDASEERLRRVLTRLVRCRAEQDNAGALAAREGLQRLLGQTLALCDLYGRRRTLLDFEAATGRRQRFAMAAVEPLVPVVEFEQAVSDLLERYPVLAPGYEAVQKVYAEGHAFALAKSADEVVTKRVQKLVAEGVRRGERLSARRAVEELGDWTAAYSEMVYQTNATTAYAAGRVAVARDPDVAEFCPAFELVGRTQSPPSRPNHAAAVGLIAATTDPVWNSMMPPLGYQGIAPWVRVSGAFVGGSKSGYSGPLVEIHTAQGTRLSVTGNHPVLTLRGWKRADDVKEGDQLVRDLRGIEPLAQRAFDRSLAAPLVRRRAVDDEQGGPLAADAFETLCAERVGTAVARARVGVFALDFHGDGRFMGEEIDVVGAYVPLPGTTYAAALKFTDELQLVFPKNASASRHGFGHRHALVDASDAAGNRPPRGGACALNDRLVVAGSSGLRPERTTRLGPSARLHAAHPEPSPDRALRNAAFALELLRAFPGEVAADEVVKVRRNRKWSGHVYDFQTTSGWMVAESVCISNCTHSVRLLDVYELRRRGLLRADGSVQMSTPPNFANAHPDPGFGRGTLATRFGV